jgi:hypothetical protein
VVNQWLWRLWHAASGAAASACAFLCGVCCTSERPLHFVKADLAVPAGAPQQPAAQGPHKHGAGMPRLGRCSCHGLHPQKQRETGARSPRAAGEGAQLGAPRCSIGQGNRVTGYELGPPRAAGEAAQLGTPAGRAALQRALQAVLDHYRGRDIAAAAAASAARRRRRRPVALELGLPPTVEALLPSRAASHIGSDSGWFDAVPVEPVEMQSDFDDDFSQTPPPAPAAAASTAPEASEPAGAAWNGTAASAVAGSPLRDAAGQQAARPDAVREGRAGDPAAREGDAVGGPARPAADLSRMGPLALTLEECWKVRARARVRVRVGSPRSCRSPRAAAPPATAAGCRPWTAGPSGAAPAPALVTQCGCDGGRAACVSALQAAVIVRWALRALGSSQVCPRAASAPRCNEMQQMAWP